MTKRILLVTGSRNIVDYKYVFTCLELTKKYLYNFNYVIVGDARGVDYLVKVWCLLNNIDHKEYPADWNRYGRGGGVVRNSVMVSDTDYGIGIHDGVSRGTADCVGKLKRAQKLLRVFYYEVYK